MISNQLPAYGGLYCLACTRHNFPAYTGHRVFLTRVAKLKLIACTYANSIAIDWRTWLPVTNFYWQPLLIQMGASGYNTTATCRPSWAQLPFSRSVWQWRHCRLNVYSLKSPSRHTSPWCFDLFICLYVSSFLHLFILHPFVCLVYKRINHSFIPDAIESAGQVRCSKEFMAALQPALSIDILHHVDDTFTVKALQNAGCPW